MVKKRSEINPDKLLCVRLKDDSRHKSLVNGFSSKRNDGLATYLKQNAWFQDQNNYRAYLLCIFHYNVDY